MSAIWKTDLNGLKVEEPRTHAELMDELRSGPSIENRIVVVMLERLESIVSHKPSIHTRYYGLYNPSTQSFKRMMTCGRL